MTRRKSKKSISPGYKSFTILLILSLIFSSAFFGLKVKSEENITITKCNIKFDQPLFQEVIINDSVFTNIKINDCISMGSTGSPMLPVYTARILVPYQKKVKSITVDFEKTIQIDFDLIEKPVAPQQLACPLMHSEEDFEFSFNETIYQSETPILEQIFSKGPVGYCRGYQIQTIFLHPIKYIPKSGIVHFISEMTIKACFENQDSGPNNVNLLRNSWSDEQVISDLVENPEEIESYNKADFPLGDRDQSFSYSGGLCDSSETYDYVIITNNSLNDTTGYNYNWSDLVRHRLRNDGLSGTIVTVENISSCVDYWNETSTFNDTQARIREFCKDAYQDWETQYILIGGEWDSESSHQIVPYRSFEDRFEEATYDTMACDLYYSHLDGDWYYQTDSIWGGGKDSGVNDLYGELYLGRITVSSPQMVSNAVNKIINYDTNSSLNDSWLNTCTFSGGDLGWSATSKDYMEEIRLGTDTYRTFTGFEEWNTANPDYDLNTSNRFYHQDLGSDFRSYFDLSIENDEAAIINNIDHSHWTNPFGLASWDDRYNTKPFFGFTQGCLAGRYQSGLAGCESLMCSYNQRHAFGLVLNTGYGYGTSGSTDGASQYIQSYFWDYFFNNQSSNQNHWQLGKAMNYCQDKIAAVINSESNAWCYAWYSAHLFGDPAQTLRIRINSTNTAVISSGENPANNSLNVSITTSSINITLVDQEGDPFNWTIETSPDIGSSNGNSDLNGSKTCNITSLEYNTSYYWFVNATDGNLSTNETFVFTTENISINQPPNISNPSINNGSTGVEITIENLTVSIEDPDSDLLNWSIETHPNIGNNFGNNESSGSKTCNITSLEFNTTYYWFINATDGSNWTNKSYFFQTRSSFLPEEPAGFNANPNGRFQIDLNWSNDDKTDATRIEYSQTGEETWNVGDQSLLYNGTGTTISHSGLNPGSTIYYKAWSYNQTDNLWSNPTIQNQTTSENNIPTISFENPNNQTININLDLSQLNVTINDIDGDLMNYTIETMPEIGDSAENNRANGSKICNVSNLNYSTTYYWFVNLTDGYQVVNETFYFTTRSQYQPNPPTNFYVVAHNRTVLNLSWTNDQGNRTYIEVNNNSDWNWGEGTTIYNGTEENLQHTDLEFNTKYYYQIWAYNQTDNCFSLSYNSANATTNSNNPPTFILNNPINNSVDQNLSLLFNVNISDSDCDLINWSIECQNGQTNQSNQTTSGIKTLTITSLDYLTSYYVWVNATDNYDNTNAWYVFTTLQNPAINNPPNNSDQNPANQSTSISINLNTVSVVINDSENDSINWTIETSPDIGNSSGFNQKNGTKTCNLSSLDYSTTYYWFVNATDGYNYTNETYHFTTENAQNNYQYSGGSDDDENQSPTADPGGPYVGQINSSLTFEGSDSYDNDGTITSYQWDFGDGNTGTGETVTHTYTSLGNYTLSLTVIDNDEASDSESTTVQITSPAIEEDNDSENTEEQNDLNSDEDDDGIPDYIEDQIGEDKNNVDLVGTVEIEGFNHYLFDIDQDGIIDVFYNTNINKNSDVKKIDENIILIDLEDDGTWDYSYNLNSKSYAPYSPLSEKQTSQNQFLNSWMIIFALVILLVVIITSVFKDKISIGLLNYQLKRFGRNNASTKIKSNQFVNKSQLHFFSKEEKKKAENEEKLDDISSWKKKGKQEFYFRNNKPQKIFSNDSNLKKSEYNPEKSSSVERDLDINEIRKKIDHNDYLRDKNRSKKISSSRVEEEIDSLIDNEKN